MDFAVLFLWGSDGLWGCFFCGGQMDFGVLFLWGSDGLWGAFFVGVRWTLGCFFCGGQMDFGVLFLWGSDGLWGVFFCCACFQPRQPTGWEKKILQEVLFLGCFFCGGQMDFAVPFFVGVRWTLGCFFVGVRCFFCGCQMDFAVLFFVPVLNRQGFHFRWLFEACHYARFLPWVYGLGTLNPICDELLTSNFVTCWKFFPLNFSAVCCLLCVNAALG